MLVSLILRQRGICGSDNERSISRYCDRSDRVAEVRELDYGSDLACGCGKVGSFCASVVCGASLEKGHDGKSRSVGVTAIAVKWVNQLLHHRQKA